MNETTKLAGKPAVAMAGIGWMGHGIARNLLRNGYPLTFLRHPGNRPVEDLLQAGATTADTPAELAAGADVLVLCVTGSAQVESVLMGSAGALAQLRPGTIVIDCSTAEPSASLRVEAAIRNAGGRYLDAPMTRTAREAEEGRLALLVGGDADLLEQCRPLLSTFAETIRHVGPTASGHRMKLLHNFVSLGSASLIAEAAACALRAKIDPKVFVEVLAAGGGAGVALDRMRPFISDSEVGTLQFSLSNSLKDIDYYRRMAGELGAASEIADGLGRSLNALVAAGHGEAQLPQAVALLRERGGPRKSDA